MTDLNIDWTKINWVKPFDLEILRYSYGKPWSNNCLCAYEHVNWAYKESGILGVVNLSSDCSLGFGVLVAVCQKYVKENNLKEPPPGEVIEKKKSWWKL